MNPIFAVANGINTSYIDSLLIALFYKESYLQQMLFQQTENEYFSYLQDLIYINFIDNVRNSKSVDSFQINEIRNYSYMCGWKNTTNIIDLYDVIDYFSFIMDGFTKKNNYNRNCKDR